MDRQKSALRGSLRRSVLPAAAFLVFSLALRARAQANWTFMVYLDGDNSLEQNAIDDFIEMGSAVISGSLNIVVQFDRKQGDSVISYGDWGTCKRFRVTYNMTPTPANEIVGDLGEIDMADPAELTDFINWAVGAYPADNYALVIWNHISSDPRSPLEAVLYDETSNAAMSIADVRSALAGANEEIDLLGFDACIMGMLEVAYELRDASPVAGSGPGAIVFSEDSEEGDGWPYDVILADLDAANPTMTATELGVAIADDFYDYYSALEVSTGGELLYTQSVIKPSELDTLVADVGNLALLLRGSWASDPAAVKTAAESVISSLSTAVIHERHDVDTPGASGLSIYFPSIAANLDATYTGTTLDFTNDTQWDEFLSTDYYTSMIGSWVSDARRKAQEFDEDTFVDLKDLCERLVNHATGVYYVDLIPIEQTGVAGTAKGWQADDESWELPLPFSFPFFGQDYTSVWVCSNGFLEFALTQPTADYDNSLEDLKTRKMIAPLWANLDTTGGDIYVHQDDPGTPTYVCIRWDATELKFGMAVAFEVLLYTDGRIQFNYLLDHNVFYGYWSLQWIVPPPTAGVSAGDGGHYEPSFYDFVWDLYTVDSEIYTPSAPEITSFTATPGTLVSGDAVTLDWVTLDMVSVSIDNGVGTDLELSGNDVKNPTQTTTYTLTAVDPLGNVFTASATVLVEGLTLVYPAGGEVIVADGTAAITWTSSDFTGQVKIEFSRDGNWNDGDGSDVELLVTGIADAPPRSWDWPVPDEDLPPWALTPGAPVCRIRISDAADGIPSFESGLFSVLADADDDGLPNGWESYYSSANDPGLDFDADGLTNLEEYLAGTDPTDQDSDGDGLLDNFEVAYAGLDPLDDDSDGNGTLDGDDNHDADQLTNLEEQTAGTDPTLEDTDGDTLPDHWEYDVWQIAQGWLTPGLLDPTDAWSGRDQATEPRDDVWDLDGDGRTNYWEWQRNTDPTNDLDPPPAGTTRPGGCLGEGAGSTGSFAWLVLALAAGLAALRRRPVRSS